MQGMFKKLMFSPAQPSAPRRALPQARPQRVKTRVGVMDSAGCSNTFFGKAAASEGPRRTFLSTLRI